MSLNQAQDIQVTALYKVMQERAFIANGSAVDESKIGWARVEIGRFVCFLSVCLSVNISVSGL